MEAHKRTELIDALLEEAGKKIAALATTLTAQGIPGEQNVLQEERTWWEKAHQGLSDAREAVEQAAIYERSRGASQ
jgi:hypothetical protein